jgi:Holliday junction resolvasome RuvABC endonuclease subunit
VIEDYAYGARGRGLTGIHEHGGVVRNFLYRVDAPFVVVQNAVIKQYATGSGKATKPEMVAEAKTHWPELPDMRENDNLADAYFMAHFGNTNYSSLVQNA